LANKPYITRSGDTWDAIAYRAIGGQRATGPLPGDERFMYLMLEANPEQNYVARFNAGVELVVPDLPVATVPSSLPPWRVA
jgi:phage tail protein X